MTLGNLGLTMTYLIAACAVTAAVVLAIAAIALERVTKP